MRMRLFNARKWTFVLALVVGSVTSTGCYDRQELEQQAFVSILGIDKAPNGLIDCTFTLAVPTSPTGGGGGKPPLAASGPVTYRAHDITEALMVANSSVERSLTLSHLTAVVFGEDLAKDGVLPYLETLARFREFRRTVFVGVAKQSARSIMSANKPMLEQSTGRIAEDIARIGERNGVVLVRHLHELLTALEDDHSDPILPLYAVNQSVKADPKGELDIEGKGVNFAVGKVERRGGNPVEWTGAALFRGDKLIGELNGKEVAYLRILQGEVHTTKLDFDQTLPGFGPIGVSIRKERHPSYGVLLSDPMQIRVDIPLEADLLSGGNGQDFSNAQLRIQLERQLNQQVGSDMTALMKKIFNDLDVDPIPVSRTVRRRFATHQQWSRYPWEQKLTTAKVAVTVSIQLRRFGIQSLPPIDARK